MIRLIWHGGSAEVDGQGKTLRKGISENSAFYHAAQNVLKDYPTAKDTQIKTYKITNARDIVNTIAAQGKNTIRSMDILSHGSGVSLNFYKVQYENCGFVSGSVAKAAYSIYMAGRYQSDYGFATGFQYISAIDFGRFTDDARIELHGCQAATDIPVIGNIAADLSQALFDAGKHRAIVIGHVTKATPSIKGTETKIRDQDYRHGKRAIYHRGKILFFTKKDGAVLQKDLDQYLKP